jgi:hypothetical protein
MGNQNSESFDVVDAFAARDCILELTSNVGEPIAVKHFLTRIVFGKDLNIGFGKWFHRYLVKHLKLPEVLINLYLQFRLEECLELLNVI